MQASGDERERTLRVIREVANEISRRMAEDPSSAERLRSADAEAPRRALVEEACRRVGLSPDAYAATLAGDPGLLQIERSAFQEATVGQQDPGPYDALSPRDPIGSSDAAPGTPAHEPAPIEAGRDVPSPQPPQRRKAS